MKVTTLCLALLSTASSHAASEQDPWEGFNRSVFKFNDAVDEAALKPLAEGYKRWVPELVRAGVDNVLGNIGDVWSTVNHVLQGKGVEASTMGFRVVTNTVFGLGGLLDPASEMGMERQSEDFGQTLGRWGMPSGPYLVLPLLGPSTARDGAARVVDSLAGPTALVHGTTDTAAVLTLQIVSTRAGLLGASQMLDEIALDRYQFLRDAYLARRRNQVYDGNPPEEPEAE